jgi:hypothetical protein
MRFYVSRATKPLTAREQNAETPPGLLRDGAALSYPGFPEGWVVGLQVAVGFSRMARQRVTQEVQFAACTLPVSSMKTAGGLVSDLGSPARDSANGRPHRVIERNRGWRTWTLGV